ncbi:MAG: hypothetical protein M3328_06220, partial [Chloroflexota bacterium]|nr:hypothetical protein [Chloroflexota bacterium]
MASRVELETNLQEIDLSAGETSTVSITVSNAGNVVDAFDITVLDLDPSWYTITPTQVSLFPQAKGTVTLQLHPPAQATVLAGLYPFQVIATSRDDPSERASILLQFTLAAVADLALGIEPQRIVARRGTFNLTVTNAGNTERQVVLRPSDPDALLLFTFGRADATAISRRLARADGLPADTPTSPDATTMNMNVSTGRPVGELEPLPTTVDTEWTEPGGEAPQGSLELTLPASTSVTIPMTVATRRRIWTGPETPLKFEVAATPPGVEWEETEARRINGELVYRPLLAIWAGLPMATRRVLAILIPLLILALLLFLLLRPTGNPNGGTVNAGATQTALALAAAQTQTAAALAAAQTQTAVAAAAAANAAAAAAAAAQTQTALAAAGAAQTQTALAVANANAT